MARYDRGAASGTDRTDFYDDITNRIISDLEAGRVPWVQPWGTPSAGAPLAMPQNAATGRRYLDEILSVGGSRPALESFKAFRGREPRVDALLRHSGMIAA